MKTLRNFFNFNNLKNGIINHAFPLNNIKQIKKFEMFSFSKVSMNMFSSNNGFYKSLNSKFASIQKYKPEKPGDSHKSQKGIFLYKRNTKGYYKSFSMKHTLRKFKVNSNRVLLHSKILNKNLYIHVSARAYRTIKLYGGLDSFIQKAPKKIINDSLFSKHLKNVLKDENINNCSKESKYRVVAASGIKNTTAKRKKAKYLKKEILPSVYYPPEALKNDLSTFKYPRSKFISRLEQLEIDEISKEIEITTDYSKKQELTKKLLVLQKDETAEMIDDLLELQPIKNNLIRKYIKSLDIDAKIHYLELLKISEGYIQNTLKEKYVHFSDDQPEIQLMLQELEIEKQNKSKALLNKAVVENRNTDGSVFEGQLTTFDPYAGRLGRDTLYETNFKRKMKKVERKDNEITKKKTKYANDISFPDLTKIHYDN